MKRNQELIKETQINGLNDEEITDFDQYPVSNNNPIIDWIIRVFKGMAIGIGGILPGLSGGVLSVVFGVYNSLIAFLAHPFKNFKKNFKYFLPIGIGGILGVFVFSKLVSTALQTYEAFAISLFLGFVAGTLPSLWKKAGAHGRSKNNIITLVLTAIIFIVVMITADKYLSLDLPSNFGIWIFSGVLIGLGVVVPGLSPSNFLLYFNLYEKMTTGISKLDFGIIIPLAIGLALSVILLAKVVENLFKKHFATMYHIILGLVLGSTVAIFFTHIIPAINTDAATKLGMNLFVFVLITIIAFAIGTLSSYFFSIFEEKVDTRDDK